MTTAHHLRLIEAMRTAEFPAERIRSGSGTSGPGYHRMSLHADVDHWDEDEVRGLEHRAQCLAEHDALLVLLTGHWGEPQMISLWSAQERMATGEETPEAWAETVAGCEYLQLWRIEDRWVALGLCLEEDGPGCELCVVVTEIDPP
ncbi:hypothetical protein ACFVWY_11825 [Streptomyces sp. NPDC058195]|uniref:hypothetical protein n=1 Tax=Streptomyces sp. NPDC058195 TaxID=3346375 RepID=UPI0036E430F3